MARAQQKEPAGQAELKGTAHRIWHFLWYEDSVASWLVSIALAFVLIKFVLYPLLGLALGTSFPVVAVVSDSMEHNEPLETWWARHEDLYLRAGITQQEFRTYPMQDGFDKGDIILLLGTGPERLERGDIIVFWGGQAYPIIHRIIGVGLDDAGSRYFQTKGDNNLGQIIRPPALDERHVPISQPCASDTGKQCQVVLGRAVLRVPLLGWVKIWFVELLQALGVPAA